MRKYMLLILKLWKSIKNISRQSVERRASQPSYILRKTCSTTQETYHDILELSSYNKRFCLSVPDVLV